LDLAVMGLSHFITLSVGCEADTIFTECKILTWR
jgi:hypothetical protein